MKFCDCPDLWFLGFSCGCRVALTLFPIQRDVPLCPTAAVPVSFYFLPNFMLFPTMPSAWHSILSPSPLSSHLVFLAFIHWSFTFLKKAKLILLYTFTLWMSLLNIFVVPMRYGSYFLGANSGFIFLSFLHILYYLSLSCYPKEFLIGWKLLRWSLIYWVKKTWCQP